MYCTRSRVMISINRYSEFILQFFEKELHIEKLYIPEFPAVMMKPLFIISLKLKIKTYANSLKFK